MACRYHTDALYFILVILVLRILVRFTRILFDPKCRVSEPACFEAAPAPEIFYPEPAPAPGKREHNVGIFLN